MRPNRYIFLTLSLFCTTFLFAQGNFTPCFDTEVKNGCFPLKIIPKDCSTAPANLIFYDYGDGRGPVPDKEITYTKAGRYAITQYINTGGSGGARTDGQFFVNVSDPIGANFDVELCANFSATVKVNSTDYNNYFIDFGNGQSAVVKGGESATTTYSSTNAVNIRVLGNTTTNTLVCGVSQKTINPVERPTKGIIQRVQVLSDDRIQIFYQITAGTSYRIMQTSLVSDESKRFDLGNGSSSFISPDRISNSNLYRYRVLAVDRCNGEEFFAAEAITAHQLNVVYNQQTISLGWNPSNDAIFTGYTIYKNNQILAEIKDREVVTFTDRNAKCGEQYCYRIEATANGGTTKSISATKCVTVPRDSNPQPVAQFVANVVRDRVEIRWQVPTQTPPVTTILLRADESGNLTRLVIPNTPPYIDVSADILNKDYCYKLFYTDECGNTSAESVTACPMRLSLSKDSDNVLLNWVASGINNLVIEKLDDNGNPYTAISVSGNALTEPKAQLDRQVTRYRLRGNSNGILVYSNVVSIRIDAVLVFPNAFSPNYDGLNDTFSVKANFIQDFHLQVFSRWGILVYDSTDPNASWDGTYKGEIVPAGEYIYAIEGADTIGKKINQKGILTIIR
jgi:gliding motility-associated-like protein